MRHGQNKRMRGRPNNNRRGPNPLTRSYESNGPDVKIRGNAHHVAEKYLQLARDAHTSGDPVAAENYLQHAEHYFRLIASAQAAQLQAQLGGRPPGEVDYDDDDEDDVLADRFASPSERVPPPPPLPPYAAPQPQYAPGYQPGMFQNSGSGFLGSALRTAAGVAGGVMAANALEGLFTGNHGTGGSGMNAGFGQSNFGQQNFGQQQASPWAASPTGGADPLDQGGDSKSYPQPDNTAWNPAPTTPDTGWQDASNTQDSGWQDASSGSDSSSDSGWTDDSNS